MLSGYSLALPVIHAELRPDGGFSGSGDVAGTCFSIGCGIFLTAGHVARGIRESGKIGVVIAVPPARGDPVALPVIASEELPCDIGLLRVPAVARIPGEWIYTLRWRRDTVTQFDGVRTLGFAYGSHKLGERSNLIQRAFQGYIVSDPPAFDIPGLAGEQLAIYELSFPAPRGLSGSPLLFGDGTLLPAINVVGVIIGNSQSSMLVYESGERLTGNDKTTVVERYESLNLGMAVQATDVLALHSELLDSTIGDHIDAQGLLVAH